YVESSSNWVSIPVLDANGRPLSEMTANGFYRAIVAGYTQVRLRAEPSSGAVTATGRLSRGLAEGLSNPNAPAPNVALHSAASANAYSSGQTVGNYSLFSFQVTGTWTGAVRVQGQITSTSDFTFLPVYDTAGNLV